MGLYDSADPDAGVTLYSSEMASADVVIGDLIPVATPWKDDPDFGAGEAVTTHDLPAMMQNWAVDRATVSPGESLFVLLYWRVKDTCNAATITPSLIDASGVTRAKTQPWQA